MNKQLLQSPMLNNATGCKAAFTKKLKFINAAKIFLIAAIGLLCATKINAQFSATWPLTTDLSPTVTGTASATSLVPGTNPGAVTGNGYQLQSGGVNWPTVATDGYHIDFPLSPQTGFDITLDSLSFRPRTSGSSGNSTITLAYQVDGAGPWIAINGNPPFPYDFNGSGTGLTYKGSLSNVTFFSGHTYVVRMYVYYTGTSSGSTSRTVSIRDVVFKGSSAPAGTPPNVTTVSATGGKYSGSVDATITAGTIPVTESGVTWGNSANPTIFGDHPVQSSPVATTGNYTINITGLAAGTTYHVRAYVVTAAGVVYGQDVTFTTNAPTAPLLQTAAATNVLSTKATSGGTNVDSGGVHITEKGLVYNTTGNPLITNGTDVKVPFAGDGSADFLITLLGLTPSTQYFVKAYAINSLGTSYGNEVNFTTLAPVPTITATPDLNFGSGVLNSNVKQSYTLSGTTLTPDGTITITAPDGFTVSTTSGSGYAQSIQVPYTGTSFTTTIYVNFTAANVGPYTGAITHTGGGAQAVDITDITVSGNGILPAPPVTSNVGNDFWLGFGYHTAMDQKDGDEANLSIYVSSADKDATVVVEMPGLGAGFTKQEVFIPKGTVQEISGFPRGDNDKFNPSNQPDSRLYYTGVSNRAIHLYSKDGTPVSAWLYTYSKDNSAAGSMIFPTNTWNTAYSVQAYGNTTNSGNPNSFFFVIAENDSTKIEFVPSVNILDSATGNLFTDQPTGAIKYFAGQTYDTVLNRGQVFNAMSSYSGKAGLDLSGTTVKSLDCSKKIAVFGGNGRVLVDVNIPQQTSSRTGSDNLIQQMFPKVAWGTIYYTVPTKHMEYNLFRINVDDPATVVKANGTQLTGLLNGYYEYQTNVPSLIESDKPISVTQFISAQAYATGKVSFGSPSIYGMNGIGDPEMIILSPAQQAIKKVTVYSPSFKNNKTPAGGYINVVIPKGGISSFRLDSATNLTQMVDTGSSSYTGIPFDPAPALIAIKDAFQPYTADTNYYWAKFRVEFPAAHTLASTVPFNAIAYGTNDGESYGFNAGTQLNDLTSPLIIQNPYGGPTQKLTTCRGTDFQLSAVFPYETNKITFSFGNTPVTPNTDTTISVAQGNLPFDSTFSANGTTYYVYRLSTKYNFTQLGDYTINVTSFNKSTTDECGSGSDKTIAYTVNVVAGVTADFDIAFNSCVNDSVILTDKSNGLGYDIIKWNWSYNNGATRLTSPNDTVQNPRIKNPADNAAANFTLLAVNNIGCFNTTTKALPTSPILTVTLPDLATVCSNAAAYQLPAGTPAGGSYSGDGVTATGLFNPAQAGAGSHVITYKFTGQQGCGDSAKKTIIVSPSTTLSINNVSPLCVTDKPITLIGNPQGGTFSTNSPGLEGNLFNPVTAGVGQYTITYSVGGDCAAPVSTVITVNGRPQVDAGPDLTTAARTPVTFKATASAGSTYLWSPADGLSSSTILTPVATIFEAGTYTYTLTASIGSCEASDKMTLTVTGACIDPPIAFTPNGDGKHDYWKIYNPECVRQLILDIFNRWGSRVYHSDNYDNKWEGKYDGRLLPDGTYYYVIKALDQQGHVQPLTGNVTIIR